jgi:hypothetical protein
MRTPRRDFLKNAGLTAAALAALSQTAGGATPTVVAPTAAAPERATPALRDEVVEWEAMQQQPIIWDTSWPSKITGRHRAMFDVPEIDGGSGVVRAGLWARQYMDVLKVPASDLSTVIVIRHAAIPLLMTHEFWTTYDVGKREKIKDERGRTQKTNPVVRPTGDTTGGGMANYMLDRQIANGAIVLGCNLAFRSIVTLVEQQDKLTGAEARAKAMRFVLPGVIMQPSGIFANVLAGEAGCHFVRAV